jgi:hypothetical protein
MALGGAANFNKRMSNHVLEVELDEGSLLV